MAPELETTSLVKALLTRGVSIRAPGSVYVDASVNPEQIAPGVVLHPGVRLEGASTSLGPGAEVGGESPATVIDCQLGEGVSLKGGFFQGATFLAGATVGSGAHVRSGTLLEEQASGAHAVGLKQTILMPYVTMGSLINFCDCLMAGGTSRKNHSEVGSSYIHFNFTPRQDKATPSLIGDVPRGVMLDQPPIFLGGQGGLVGPARIAFGCIIPAGTVHRGDALQEGMLLATSPAAPEQAVPFDSRKYGRIDRVVRNNLLYIGNLEALRTWYRHVRGLFLRDDPYERACHEGAVRALELVLKERRKRLEDLAGRMPDSIAQVRRAGGEGAEEIMAGQRRLMESWPEIADRLAADHEGEAADRDLFLGGLERVRGHEAYLTGIQQLDGETRRVGTRWLQGIVDSLSGVWHPPSS